MKKYLSGILSKKIGEQVEIQPEASDVKLLWITVEDVDLGTRKAKKPSMWFYIKDKLYYCVCDSYNFHMLETYDDWDDFDCYFPKVKEIETLLQFNPIFFEVNTKLILDGYLGNYCEFELNFIKEYHRVNSREDNINRIID